MHNFLAAFSSFLVLLVSFAAARGEEPFIPAPYAQENWRQIAHATGDLNKDGITDKAVILEAPDEITEPGNWCSKEHAFSQAPVRRLLIAFGKAPGGFDIIADDPKAILRRDEGGTFGDPIEDLRIERGSLVINYFAGSRWRWGVEERFRFQDAGFYLIGLREFSLDSISNASTSYDFNPLTSKVQVTVEESPDAQMRLEEPTCIACREGENCPGEDGCYAGSKRMGEGEVWFDVARKPLVSLADYRCWQQETGMLKHTGFQNGR